MAEMKDFLGKDLHIGDKVIFIYDKFKVNELKEGVVIGLNIRQAKYDMIKVQWINPNNILVDSNVTLKKVYKL